jgi:S-phase kinase-associated protein 1
MRWHNFYRLEFIYYKLRSMGDAYVVDRVGHVVADDSTACDAAAAGHVLDGALESVDLKHDAKSNVEHDSEQGYVHYCKSEDNVLLPLTLADLACNKTLQNCIEDCGGTELDPLLALPVPYSAALLRKVLQFTLLHGSDPEKTADEFATWKTMPLSEQDVAFVGDDIMFHRDLLLVANFLDNKRMLDVLAKRMAERIVGKTPEEIKALFQSQETVTLQDVQRLRTDHPWVVAHAASANGDNKVSQADSLGRLPSDDPAEELVLYGDDDVDN